MLEKLLAGGIKGLFESISGIIDSINAPKENREIAKQKLAEIQDAHAALLIEQSLEIEKAYLSDINSARDANVKIQTAGTPSWLAKNIPYIIAIFVLLIWGSTTLYVLAVMTKVIQADKDTDFTGVLGVLVGITGLATSIIQFYFGSSIGSHDKQRQLDNIQKT